MIPRQFLRTFSTARRARIRARQQAGQRLDAELDALRLTGAPLRASLDAVTRIGAPPNDRRNIGRIIERAVALRPCADTAAEAYVRLGTDCCEGLAVVARSALLDPVPENRSARILSVLRHLRRSRILPDAELLFACFKTAVSAADIGLAATIHNVALASRFVAWPIQENDDSPYLALVRSSALPGPVGATTFAPVAEESLSKSSSDDSSLPPVIEYYNGIVRAALLSSSHGIASAALRELHARGAGVNEETVILLATAHAELDDATGALALLDALPSPPPPLPLAALIRTAARARDFHRVKELVQRGPSDMKPSPACVGDVPVTRRTLAAAGDDVFLAAFLAARSCSDLDGALWMLQRLYSSQHAKASSFVLGVIAETAWRANRPYIAREIHTRLEQRKLRNIAPYRIVKRTIINKVTPSVLKDK